MFILLYEMESISSPGDAFCQGLICRDLFHSMPSFPLYILLFMCNVLKDLDYIQDMPCTQCTFDVLYVFQDIYFKSRKIYEKNNMLALHNGIYFLVTFVIWLLFHGILKYSCLM